MGNAVTVMPSRSSTVVGSGFCHIDDADVQGRAFGARLHGAERRAEHLKRAGLGIEHAAEEGRKVGRHAVAGGADDRQWRVAHAIASPHQRGEVGGVIGMQVADADHFEIGELGPALPEADVGPAADVEKEFRLRSDPQQIAGRGAFCIDGRAAGAENLHGDRIAGAGLRRS